ncbi:Fungalysin/Thermolysin Propeptide Motif [Solimonas aquatica]|uniref:Fungalysin/Thermolysin Propeptide Motif n=1 Tax=Solimonas aquatica TaxID=489703 RepID=A0A1H9FWB0_9GAMM|nr:M36 family metallopeptidase [Solimonas aquatica]SEQ42079.1 Fungalysin/Thermolysin Propeptide Motif [Solimonas aquatica]
MRSLTFQLAMAVGLATASAAVQAAQCVLPPEVLAHATRASNAALAVDAESGDLPGVDRARRERRASGQLAALPQNLGGRLQPALFDRHLGQTTFLWARRDASAVAVGPLKTREQLIARARAHLRSEAAALRLSEAMISEAQVVDAQYNGNGPAVVRFRQQVLGREVFGRSLNVLLDRSGKPVAVSGYFATDYDPAALGAQGLVLSAAQAIAGAWRSIGGAMDAAQLRRAATRGGYDWYAISNPGGELLAERQPRIKQVYYARGQRLEPAYYTELFATGKRDGRFNAYGLLISAVDGSVLHRRSLVARAKAYTYGVFADGAEGGWRPYDSPLGNGFTPFPGASPDARVPRVSSASTQRRTLSDAGTGDPWLPDDATTTIGNNVRACIDRFDLSGYNLAGLVLLDNLLNTCARLAGDIYPPLSAAGSFDYPLGPDQDPKARNARYAAAVNLFYVNNWLHDWWYGHGFNEAAGNAQTSNYGRGGEENDALIAQGQDGSGRNNANMATPADGSPPRMQQYLFDGPVVGTVRQTAPVSGAPLTFTVGSFTPASYDIPATAVVLANDRYSTPTDGCGVVVNDPSGLGLIPSLPPLPQLSLRGKIALIDRGSCPFTTKARFAQISGAVAAVIVNNSDADPIPMGNADIPLNLPLSTDWTYRIPTVMIRRADGELLKQQLAAGQSVKLALHRDASLDLDGTLDNQIVAHEFFHYVHHRLTDSSSQQTGAMSEGWADFDALLLSVRADEHFIVGNEQYQGAYDLAGYVMNNFYHGIRRAPYSTDFAKNAYTFRHIAEGEPTPDGGSGLNNSEVHNAGEIWANQLWECYAGLLNDGRYSQPQAQSRIQDYVIAGLKMTPADATFTEQRDAVLAAVLAGDFQDFKSCSEGFAKRGAGLLAVAPARDSTDFTGVVEDYTPFVCPTP